MFDNIGNVRVLSPYAQDTGFQFAHIQHVDDHVVEVIGTVTHGVEHLGLLFVDVADNAFPHQRNVFLDHGQRRAKLVGNIVDELVRHSVQFCQSTVLLLQQSLVGLDLGQKTFDFGAALLATDGVAGRPFEDFRRHTVFDQVILCSFVEGTHGNFVACEGGQQCKGSSAFGSAFPGGHSCELVPTMSQLLRR